FFTKNYGRPSLFVPQPCRLQTLLVKVQLFILGGGPRGHEPLPSKKCADSFRDTVRHFTTRQFSGQQLYRAKELSAFRRSGWFHQELLAALSLGPTHIYVPPLFAWRKTCESQQT